MDVEGQKTYFCPKCRKTLNADNFYSSNNAEKYPEGKLYVCKKCFTMHVDNFVPEPYLPLLEECDVPYVPDVWNNLLQRYAKNKTKLTGVSVLGRYLSTMKLNQWAKYRWEDTEYLQEIANKEIEEAVKRQGYSASEIDQVIATSVVPPPPRPVEEPEETPPPQEDYFTRDYENDFVDDLTEEDKTYLRLKWGKTYKPEEWVRLEQLYEEMMGSYDIQGAGHIDTLKLVCKTSLKSNQLLDIGDVEGAQKMVRMYDSLMKSGNFTALQNKTDTKDFIDSIGELVELCEQQGYIERYYVDKPKDKVDLTIADMQKYTRTLIEEETNLAIMVEKALREIDKEDKEDNNIDDIIDDTEDFDLSELEKQIHVNDSDYVEFADFIDAELEAQEEL